MSLDDDDRDDRVYCIFGEAPADECAMCTGEYCSICRGPCDKHDWDERHAGRSVYAGFGAPVAPNGGRR